LAVSRKVLFFRLIFYVSDQRALYNR